MPFGKDLIDVHVHVAAFPSQTNGCRMSPHFEKSWLVKLVPWKLGLSGKTPDEINASYEEKLVKDLRASRRVARAVTLALDGVYGEDGTLDVDRTHMLVGNAYVAALARRNPDLFLFGASVNPQRRDALDELARVSEAGAVLVKLLPNSQAFDPLDKRYQPFFRALADRRLPALCHIGYEFSVTAGKQEYGRPEGLRQMLDQGVSVIAAHGSSSGIFTQGTFFSTFVSLCEKYPNLFTDLSAITLPNRAGVVRALRRATQLKDRLLFGTDYPLSAYATPFLGRLSPRNQWRFWRTKSIFDKQAGLLDTFGLTADPTVTERVLRLSPMGAACAQ
jgi:hypothetical protein